MRVLIILFVIFSLGSAFEQAILRVTEFSTLGSPGRSQVSSNWRPLSEEVLAKFHLKRAENDKLAWRMELKPASGYKDLPNITKVEMDFSLSRVVPDWNDRNEHIQYNEITLDKDHYTPWLETFSYRDIINNSTYYNKGEDRVTLIDKLTVWEGDDVQSLFGDFIFWLRTLNN